MSENSKMKISLSTWKKVIDLHVRLSSSQMLVDPVINRLTHRNYWSGPRFLVLWRAFRESFCIPKKCSWRASIRSATEAPRKRAPLLRKSKRYWNWWQCIVVEESVRSKGLVSSHLRDLVLYGAMPKIGPIFVRGLWLDFVESGERIEAVRRHGERRKGIH